MEQTSDPRAQLAQADPNFRRLMTKHREYDKRLQELRRRKYLSDDEQIEEVRLKKLKLALKDEMESILAKSDH